jgi:hypothetical protein
MNKFRVWDNYNRLWMKDDERGFYFRYRMGGGLGYVYFRSDGREEIVRLPQDHFIVQDATGLQDMDGTDIYVGDYVSVIALEHVCEVRYGKVSKLVQLAPQFDVFSEVEINCFYFHNVKSGLNCFSIPNNCFGEHDLQRTKVIGNIYDDPKGINTKAQ